MHYTMFVQSVHAILLSALSMVRGAVYLTDSLPYGIIEHQI
jgi:hypothetical protein